MKLRVETAKLRLKHTFTISRGSEDEVETVIVSLEDGDRIGFGEASPNAFYDHSAESVRAAIEKVAPVVEKGDPLEYFHLLDRLLERLEGNRAALCAIDLALHDLLGKRCGLPFYRVIGLDVARTPVSSFTIGIDSIEEMRAKTREARDFPVLKVKLGTDRDVEIVRALREESGATLRVDANCGWDADRTIALSRELAALGVEFIEQPLPPDRLDDMERVYRESALPLFADENSVVPEDLPGLVGRFHGVNIKLVKCGGISQALRMIHTARALGLRIMIGCMIESSVGISGGAHLGPLVDHLDLDGAILTSNDPFEGVENRNGQLIFSERAGLGAVRR